MVEPAAAPPSSAGSTGVPGRHIGKELTAGLSLAAGALPSSFAAGTLTYQALGPEYASFGLLAGLLAAVFGGGIGAVVRGSGFIPTTPGVAAALLQATFAMSVMTATGDVGVALAGMMISVALAGVLQILFGLAGWGAIAKYAPHPVLAGFGAGVALLLIMDQIPRLLEIGQRGAEAAASWQFGPLLAVTTLVGLMLAVSLLRPHWPAAMLGLLVAAVVFPFLPGLSVGSVASLSSSFEIGDLRKFLFPDPTTIAALPIELVWSLLANALALAAIGLLDTLIALRGAKTLADVDITPRREIAGLGAANMATSLAGGVAMTTSLVLMGVSYRSGGRTRWTPLAACAALGAALILFPGMIVSVPAVALGALLVFFALRIFDRSMLEILRAPFEPAHRPLRGRALRNAGIFLVVALVTAFYQPVAGVLAGCLLSCLVFIIDMSRPVIAARTSAEHLRSRRGRPPEDVDVLGRRGGRVVVLRLRGVLFFGNADDLDSELRSSQDAFDHVILDMRRVTDIDISGRHVLAVMARRLQAAGKAVHVSGLPRELAGLLQGTLGTFRDLDAALEHVEDLLLGGGVRVDADAATLAGLGGLTDDQRRLFVDAAAAKSYAAGQALCRVGDPGDGMWILLEGRVSVQLPGPEGPLRLAGIGAGALVGELALIEEQPRSADVVAETDVRTIFVSASLLQRLKREQPLIAQSILEWITKVTVQRLRSTSEALRFAES
ncbi:MAG: SLC26A/SulP transporter family protein [Rhizobiaceae bacterium]